MDIYAVLVNDRHSDPSIYLYKDEDTAIKEAKLLVKEMARFPEDIEEKKIEGWIYYCSYSCENDYVRVTKETCNL